MICIYKIEDKNGCTYFGQTRSFKRRISHYKSKKVQFSNKDKLRIYKSIYNLGYENHTISIVYEFPKDVTNDVIDNFEAFYINQYLEANLPLFNIRGGGRKAPLAEETKKKLSEIIKNQYKNGRIISAEMKQNISSVHTGKKHRLGQKLSVEGREKLSNIMKNAVHALPKVKVKCLNNGKIYESQRDAAKDLNISYTHIPAVCKGHRKYINGYNFIYV